MFPSGTNALDVQEETSCFDTYLSIESTRSCIDVESQIAIDICSALLVSLQKVPLRTTDGARAPWFPDSSFSRDLNLPSH